MSLPSYPDASYPSHPGQSAGGHDPYGGPAPARTNGFAVAALVLGLVACLFFWTIVGGLLLGLLAVVFGVVAALRTRQGRAPRRAMAIVGAAFGALGLIGSAIVLVLAVSVFDSQKFQDFQDCVEQADSRAAEDRCSEDFVDDLTG
ncbi:DUF4190 domain-containing protein [Streptomyces sp. NPDC059698]|uniref:DUF4190 domain-containing protein n=1 Tax=unclassified Streptomyces TaxID=2593676 RepID=UPI00093F309F|nr:DUF4190 domain-containing protein [Streptomyces sp. CB02366]OKJ34229.1 hypothetical protein AMK24_22045 [Streptomyces sp. CB02366]TVP37527.1 hypothetical protein A3L22_26550 [Streptomyces griseus subsp. griseus]WSS59098.1 DUF4190 domain-containing protein [Streptomyces sp. NBC_01178]